MLSVMLRNITCDLTSPASTLAPQMSSLLISIPLTDIPSLLGRTLGAVFIADIIASIFYGITILQTVVYYKQYPEDPWFLRYAIALLWIFDTLHVALSTHALYFYLVKSSGNYLALFGIVWSFPLQILLNMLIIPCVQILYAVRIWKLGSHFHVVLPRFIFLAVAATFGVGVYVTYAAYTLRSFVNIPDMTVSIYTNFSTISVADFVIAGAMCFYLHKGRSMTSISSTTKIIVRLMRLAVISGLVTSLCSLFTLIAYIAWPESLIFEAINFVLPRLYINSLLAMLNSRRSSMWSVEKGHHVNKKIMRFATPVAGSGTADSGETDITISDLSAAEAETNSTLPLPAMEGNRSWFE
ncbi:uncharacterized protein BT62DRAFT_329363 [Guyanagaster necrorhizus]|uniref:DUF6534 domain-containing protein n=1 Tax=Guyanagaster necrorhizus TaxID=856835 RepID=A0A9P7VMR9_9AGAR|nr:uncharacterized protein BT62DRAFT_329363 [Guyanagaster necrorhizus MCA 3950]KAG7443395.1 hypothetical protein BT62DRAFT_329363 [Guyanagaster necrorhizus MCA 3950]